MGDQQHIVMCLSVLGVVVGIPCMESNAKGQLPEIETISFPEVETI
jgi:hypothetical protein